MADFCPFFMPNFRDAKGLKWIFCKKTRNWIAYKLERKNGNLQNVVGVIYPKNIFEETVQHSQLM